MSLFGRCILDSSRLLLRQGPLSVPRALALLSLRPQSQIRLSSNVIETLRQRGFVNDVTSPELESVLANTNSSMTASNIAVYCGYDPTASSLHVGNLLSLIALMHFKRGELIIGVLFLP
jgi:hypothetical protein